MNGIIKNNALCRRLASDVKGGSLSHAYIIAGDYGSGKHTLALSLAATLSCEQKNALREEGLPCGVCQNCKKILEGKSPDIIYINKGDKASIGIDSIRFLRNDVSIAPNDLDTKIYIIEGADLMTPDAQNALLLTLEEPPRYVLFLLLCEKTTSLLETIKSRAPILRTERLTKDDIDDYIINHSQEAKTLKSSSPKEYEELLIVANGSIGNALDLLAPKLRKPIMQKRELAKEFISCFAEHGNAERKISLMSAFSSKRDELSDQLNFVSTALRDLILLKKDANAPLCFFADRDEALDLSDTFKLTFLSTLFENVQASLDAISRNANVKLTIANLLSRNGISK